MSLVTEDGAGLPDAESFASVATADSYFEARGAAAWGDLATGDKEAALRLATDYMGATYGPLWLSERRTDTQALDWPRVGWVGVPQGVERACCELALRAASGPLLPDAGPQVEREQVGPIAVVYAPGARQTLRYEQVWALLGPFLAQHVIVRRA